MKVADLIESLLVELKTYRCDEKAAIIFNVHATLLTGTTGRLSAKARSVSFNIDNFVVLTSLGKRDVVRDSAEFKRAILFPTIDSFLGELKDFEVKISKKFAPCQQLIRNLKLSLTFKPLNLLQLIII